MTKEVSVRLITAINNFLENEEYLPNLEHRNNAIIVLMGYDFFYENFLVNSPNWKITKEWDRLLDLYSGPHGKALCKVKRIQAMAEPTQLQKKAS